MRIKRYTALLLAALLALALAGCKKEDDTANEAMKMTIMPCVLSQEETALLELLNVDMNTHRVFDFQVEGAKSIRLRAYELVDGEWNCVVHGAHETADGRGRIALTFGKMTEGARMADQDVKGSFAREFAMEAGDVSGMVFATSALTKGRDIELDQEIPLALQIVTAQSEFSTSDVDYFGMPRELAKHGYEHVYAITVTFSQSAASDLLPDEPAASSAEPSAEPTAAQ